MLTSHAQRVPPRILTPDYWPATLDDVRAVLSKNDVPLQTIGTSAGGRDILASVLGPEKPFFTVAVTGGLHGHEAGGTAAAVNLLVSLRCGQDLLGQPLPQDFRPLRFVVVPLLNPDGRQRCPASFVGLSIRDVRFYSRGWDGSGHLLKRVNRIKNLKKIGHLGGLYNDAGVSVSDSILDGTPSVELAATADFLKKTGCDLMIDLHAHAFYPLFVSPPAGLPEALAKLNHEMAEEVRIASLQDPVYRKRGGFRRQYTKAPALLPYNFLLHKATGALPFLFEGPQGTIDGRSFQYRDDKKKWWCDPGFDHRQIINTYLFAITQLARSFSARKKSKG